MKTKIFKMVLPIFVLMLAIVSAFAFKSVEEKALLAIEPGWLNIPGNPCSIEINCSNTPSSTTCKAIHNGVNYNALGKPSGSMLCTKILYRIP